MTSAVVLAGGRSGRFGAQKLAVMLDGVPLLHHALRSVAAVCDEVVVAGAPGGLPVGMPDGLGVPIVQIPDELAFQGPLVALVHASHHASHDRLLLVAGDMPELQPSILRRLLAFGDRREGACLVADERRQPLPIAVRREVVLDRGAELVGAGQRSLRGFLDTLDAELIDESEWRALDPAARSLRDIDRPGDLGAGEGSGSPEQTRR